MERNLDMKTRILIVCVAAASLMLGQPARAAGNRATAFSHTTSLEFRYHGRQTHRQELSKPVVSGVIPSASRADNPLQILNPFAPAKYGTSEDNVSLDPGIPGKWDGIKLFSISF